EGCTKGSRRGEPVLSSPWRKARNRGPVSPFFHHGSMNSCSTRGIRYQRKNGFANHKVFSRKGLIRNAIAAIVFRILTGRKAVWGRGQLSHDGGPRLPEPCRELDLIQFGGGNALTE